MGIRFAKSIKIGDLLKINISKSGISATVGKKGASVNIGTKGTYLNLSPAAAGISGTGVSYRKKISGGLLSNLVSKLTGKKDDDKEELSSNDNPNIEKIESKENNVDTSRVDEYLKELESLVCIHKYADDVICEDGFKNKIESCESEASKELLQLCFDGDEDTIESLVGTFVANLDLKYDVKANYELEEHQLYVDLDLPEIKDIQDTYPCLVKNEIVDKKKTQSQIKEEYANFVMSLSVFLSANFFNISSYINEIIISGFTTRRNNDGDLVDEYLYSIKFLRDEFINTKLSDIENIYEFILKFENRIVYNSSTYSFKTIKPYEMPSIEKANSLIDDAIAGLKELGYKNARINEILPKLNECKFETSSEYLKEALKLLSIN